MNILKSLARGFLAFLFKVSLVLLIILWPLVMVFGTSDQLKTSLKASKIYDTGVDSLIESVNKDSDKSNEDNPFKDPAVQQAAKTAITPTFLQRSSESIIDGIYGWLQGKTPQPTFTIDASEVKDQFIKAAGDYAVNRAKSLPTCTVAQLRQMGTDIDPLTATCVPPGYNIEGLRDLIAQELNKPSENGEKNILQQPIITADTLPKNDNGKTPVQDITNGASNLPKIFMWLQRGPFILLGLATVSGGLLVLLYDDKRRGIRNLAVTVLPIGLLGLFGVVVTNRAFGALAKSDAIAKADATIQQPLISLLHTLSNAINQKLLFIAAVYAVLGAGTLIALHFTKPKTLATEPVTETPVPELKEETTPEEKPKNSVQ